MLLFVPDISAIVFLAGLLAGEFYLLLLRTRPTWLRIAYFVLLAAGWTIIYYLVEPPTANRTVYPQTYFWYLVWVHTVTVAAFAVGLELARNLDPRYLRHVMLAILALGIALVWPHFVLLSHCAVLECL